MDRFFEALFLGLSAGATYGLVALALVVVYRGTGHLNFAQGEMGTLSAFMVWWFHDQGVPLLLAVLMGMVFGLLLGAATEVVIVRPLARRSLLAVFVATIALFLGINAYTSGVWGAPPDELMDSLFPNDPDDFVRVFGTVWRYEDIGTLAVTLVITGLLFLLFQKTRFGLAMRGVASNPDSSRLVGIPTGRILAGSWGLAGALGALAAVMFAGTPGSGHADVDGHRAHLRHRGGRAGRARQPGRCRDRRSHDRHRRSLGGRVRARLDRSGHEVGRGPPGDLRGPALQAVGLVRHGESGASVIKINQGSIAHWVIRLVWVAAVIAVLVYIPTQATSSTIGDFTLAFEYAIAAMSLNLVLGYTGIISLGHSAFFGIGMYTTAILVTRYDWSQGWTFYVAAAIAFVVGYLVALPALRLKGIYLAVVTLALGVLFPTLIRWDKLEWLSEGPAGIGSVTYEDIPNYPVIGELRGREGRAVFIYWLAVLLLVISYLVARGIVKSRVGRSLIAIRDNETAAAVMGVPRARDQDAGVRHLGGDVRDRRLPVDAPAQPGQPRHPQHHPDREHHVPPDHGARRRGDAVGADHRRAGLRLARCAGTRGR